VKYVPQTRGRKLLELAKAGFSKGLERNGGNLCPPAGNLDHGSGKISLAMLQKA
jgi:hypothetical protein